MIPHSILVHSILDHSINTIINPGVIYILQRCRSPFNSGGYSGDPPFNDITQDHSICWGDNIFDCSELYYYDCCVMGIEFIMWCIIILLLIVFVVWFMEGYYVRRYDNVITRLWREYIVGDDF